MCLFRRNAGAHVQAYVAGNGAPSWVAYPQTPYWSPQTCIKCGFELLPPNQSAGVSAHIPPGFGGSATPCMLVPHMHMLSGTIHPPPMTPMAPQWTVMRICPPLSFPSTLVWDIRKHPSSATTTIISRGKAMFSAATTPVTDHISIRCRAKIINKMWPDIQVVGSPVTVECVLKAIHDYFQEKITEEEYTTIQGTNPRKYSNLINNARHEGSGLLIQKKESIYKVPPRRVDCLGEKRNFKGLDVEYLSKGSHFIVLHLA